MSTALQVQEPPGRPMTELGLGTAGDLKTALQEVPDDLPLGITYANGGVWIGRHEGQIRASVEEGFFRLRALDAASSADPKGSAPLRTAGDLKRVLADTPAELPLAICYNETCFRVGHTYGEARATVVHHHHDDGRVEPFLVVHVLWSREFLPPDQRAPIPASA